MGKDILDITEDKEDLTELDGIPSFCVQFTTQEKLVCLKEILLRLKKVMHVYEKSLDEYSNYNYKVFCGGILLYVSSSNMMFNGELVNIIVNMNSIISNNFEKSQIKRIVFESKNQIEYLICQYETLLSEEKKGPDNIIKKSIDTKMDEK